VVRRGSPPPNLCFFPSRKFFKEFLAIRQRVYSICLRRGRVRRLATRLNLPPSFQADCRTGLAIPQGAQPKVCPAPYISASSGAAKYDIEAGHFLYLRLLLRPERIYMINHFDADIAKKVGVNAAVIFHNILFWCEKNKANEIHFYDGRYWTYNSIKAWRELFPYMTEKQIRIALNKLKKNGYIVTGNYNKSAYDRTTWYSITGQMDLPQRANGSVQKGKPIPDNKPYNKPNINNTVKAETSIEGLNSRDDKSYPENLNMEAFKMWCEYKGKKYTKKGKTLSANKLAKFPKDIQMKMVENSIMNNYAGLFEISDKKEKTCGSDWYDSPEYQ